MSANCENQILNSRTEDVLKWRLNYNLTSCISNIESGENNFSMDKSNYFNNNTGSEIKARNFYITLAKESPKNITYDSSSDTYDSFHLRETDYCKDTTDTLSDSSYTTEGIATVDMVEYEVASRSASEDFYSNDSSSGTEDILFAVVAKAAADTIQQQYGSSTSDFADTEESNDGIVLKDSELSSADYWKCVKCKNKQNNPMFRYCERCYQIRKSYFPPRPPQRKSRAELKRNITFDRQSLTFNNNKHGTSLSSSSDIDKKDRFTKMYNKNSSVTSMMPSITSTTLTSNVISDFNNSQGFGKFSNNNNNNAGNISGPSLSSCLSYNKNQLNRLTNNKNCSSSDSEDDVIKFNNFDKNDNRINKSILCDTNSLSNFFSTPKFSKNLKRKNPFEISLANNTKRFFVENSSCSSVTNLTNHYSSSNNSSITTNANNESSCIIPEKRDTNLVINDSETDLALEFINNTSNSLKLPKDSGISGSASSTAGPSSSQEYFSSQGGADLGCSSSHSDEPITITMNSICNNNSFKITPSDNKNTINNITALDDTVSEDYDDDELFNNDKNYNENKINLSQKSMGKSPKRLYKSNLPSVITDEVDHSSIMISNHIGLNKHVSDIPLSLSKNNEFSPTSKGNSIVIRSFSTGTNICNINSSPTSVIDTNQKIKNQRRHRKILAQFNSKNRSKISETVQQKEDVNKSDSCIICLDEPKNGVFVHSRFLHLCCCYRCAVKIWNRNKKCPVCNCAVKNVMKLFVH